MAKNKTIEKEREMPTIAMYAGAVSRFRGVTDNAQSAIGDIPLVRKEFDAFAAQLQVWAEEKRIAKQRKWVF